MYVYGNTLVEFAAYFSTRSVRALSYTTLSNVDAGETAPTPVTTVLSLQNLMDANEFLVLFNVI